MVRAITSESAGYTDIKFEDVNPIIIAGNGGTRIRPTGVPSWTAKVGASYQSPDLFDGGGSFTARIDADWRSKNPIDPNPDRAELQPNFDTITDIPAYWTVNGRIGLTDIPLVAGPTLSVSAWGRNIFDEDVPLFPLILGSFSSTNFVSAATYGVDVTVKF